MTSRSKRKVLIAALLLVAAIGSAFALDRYNQHVREKHAAVDRFLREQLAESERERAAECAKPRALREGNFLCYAPSSF